MTATPLNIPAHYSPITSEFDIGFGTEDNEANIISNTPTMSKSSFNTHSTAPTVLMSDLNLIEHRDSSPAASFSSVSNNSGNSSTSSLSGRSLANAIAKANANPTGSPAVDYNERSSIETPFNETPYVVEAQKQKQKNRQKQRGEAYVQRGTDQELARWSPQNEKPPQKKAVLQECYAVNYPSISQRTPTVTAASVPFQNTIPLTSFLREELEKDPAYRHALKAGTLWQSLIGQHVKLPALWFDGEEPARPYLGCEDPLKRNKWSYFGRHRVAGEPKLNSLVKNSRSSGKLLLHIICRDSETFEPTEDIVVGVFHPNADGIRDEMYSFDQQRHEDYRDVWIGHRSRSVPHNGRRVATRIESLLRYLNKNKVHKSPLGDRRNGKSVSPSSKRCVDNNNMNSVFGSRAPRHTIFVPEESLHSLLMLKLNTNAPSPPPSVILLRNFLR